MDFLYSGVKLRTHIAKALKARSHAIRKAIAEYNSVASKIQRPELDIETVLQYVTFGEFDLLREGQDISAIPWLRTPERKATLTYLKIQRANEEILRLNVEIQRLYAFIQTEESVWEGLVSKLADTHSPLMYQAIKYLKRLASFNQTHRIRLAKLKSLDGYSGPLGNDNITTEEEESNEVLSDNEEADGAVDVMLSFVHRLVD